MDLNNYMNDGANYQSQAVLAFVKSNYNNILDYSWNGEHKNYNVSLQVGRWENCREQGYVITIRSSREQLNIAFFEHRNSDRIHALMWEQRTINTPTIDIAEFGDIYKDKYDTSHSVSYGEIEKMTQWISEQLMMWGKSHYKK